ncbi:helix-turn-helix domain-containing protein [Polycladomyces subterraneus]|uniref:Helix-turn-helix domain-containing protein n=1 Tax=Polycladomyces subterraneus TaxID=1016997 RepID=A0ABT8INU0_9BACL|nr:helix-turn-helix domain-containing protein [Polycladomyces subterraneus]MDN4594418.1 helix-turn-helix domain-containing protein [Polycladomyces subterraneus]
MSAAEIGRQLKETRESLGLTMEDIQEKTRILKGHLIAIENGQFDKLPSPYYARKYLRQYAEAIGLEPQHILRKFRTDEMTQEKLLEWTQSMPAVNPEEHGPSQTTGRFATDRMEQTSIHRPSTTAGQLYRNDSQSVHSTQRFPALLSDPQATEPATPMGESPSESLSLSRTNPPVSARGRGRRRKVTRTRKKNGLLSKQRIWLWALSGVLLVSVTAGGVYSFLNKEDGGDGQAAAGKNQVTLSNAGDLDPSAQLTLVDKNEDTNKYELRSQKQIQLLIQDIDVCRVVISEQKNGAPIKDVTLHPGEKFEYEGAHAELWVQFQFPQNIRMLVNGKPVDPSFYVHIVKKLT